MKKILTLLLVLGAGIFSSDAQTGIAKNLVVGSAILDFPKNTTNGIILPAVELLPANPVNGTLLLDKSDKKVKMLENNSWIELSGTGNTTSLVPYSGTIDNGKRTIIGDQTSTADGVLVLESEVLALVLPHIDKPHLNVKGPYPGMICYDTDRKALAVYDGSVWNYWK
ncbi:MAG: hypothetical protein EOO04_29140 [Chitinophagaceae bacterium]|nr:MAG: hypothetical protein EOO04_29140 [Chitinophagaceae bacterium]